MRHILKLIVLLAFTFIGCNKSSKIPVYHPEFVNHITAYTSGIIDRSSSIKIIVAEEIKANKQEKLDPNDLLDFSPKIKGKARWEGPRTIIFQPDEKLDRGTVYQGVFYLGKLKTLKRELRKFPFRFETRQQKLHLSVEGIRTFPDNNPKYRVLEGMISTADREEADLIHQCLTATHNNKDLNIKWTSGYGTSFHFRVDSIERTEFKSQLYFKLDGNPVESEDKETRVVHVSGMGVFSLGNIEVTHEPDQKIELYFTENLSSIQSLIGLIHLDEDPIEKYELSGNKLTIYPQDRLQGNHTLTCSEDIKNYAGFRLKKTIEREVFFEQTKPKLKMIGKGSIVPNAKGVVFPFEAMALKAVDVWIYRIYEDNITQFLQVNDLDGNNELSRVGTLAYHGKVDLNQNSKVSETEWNRYTLNLSKYIDQEPGAIYRVLIGYKRSYTFFTCDEGEGDHQLDEDGMYYEYYNGDNQYLTGYTPCDSRFYYSGSLCRNILASDVGMIVKEGADKKTHVFVTSLITAQPLSNARVDFYDFQNVKLATAYANESGMAEVKLKDDVFLAIATSGKQKGYLKLGNGRNISTSKFDVGGVNGSSEIDGKIYTERGVWRPGDSIYTCFTLQDRKNTLPSNAPVTFELINPQGQVVQTMVRTTSVGDVYDFRTATQPQWKTGNYSARVTVGGSTFFKTISVETVKPNRLKILLSVKDSMLSPENNNEVKLTGRWLHGSPSPNLNYNVKGKITPITTRFKDYPDFDFEDRMKKTAPKELVLSEGVLDEKGEVVFHPNFYLNNEVKGSLRVDLMAKIFEKGGNFSQDYGSFPMMAYNSYVGVKQPRGMEYDNSLVTDKKHRFEIVNVTKKGKPISDKKVNVKIYKIDWNWWWDNHHNLSTFMQTSSLYPVLDTTVTTDGKGLSSTSFSLPYPNWGRFIMVATDPISKHKSSHVFYIDWPYWSRGNRSETEQAKTIELTSNKTRYGVNESVQVTIPSSEKGQALVCIENGTSVLKKFWVNGNNGESKFSFTTTEDMTPNVYVHVSYLQKYHDKDNDLPPRLYGILPIKVEDKRSHLHPVLKVKDEIRPDRRELVQVQERDGRPMTYTLAVVDEGLLDLTHFRTPVLWNHFYQKQGLGVRTWDLYDEVMGGYEGKYGNVLSVGGDEAGAGDESLHKANRFKPAVRFIGPFKLKPGETAKHYVEMGDYIGAVRMMVVARQGIAYGEAEKSVAVKKPLMVLPTLPRVLTPGEKVKIPVTVFSLEEGRKTVKVSLATSGNLNVVGPKEKTIEFQKSGDETIYFMAEVEEQVGVANVKVEASMGSEVAKKSIEIAIRTPNPMISEVDEYSIPKGSNLSVTAILKGLDGTNNCAIEVSSLPPLNLHSRLDELLQYPHGCVEQTTSSVFAQLFLEDILTLSEQQRLEIDMHVQAAIQRLKLFQNSTGGLGYWPGSQYSNDWGTSYAGHFLLLAENKGYKLDARFKKNWVKYQKKQAKDYSGNNDLVQAYRLYTLVLAGEADIASMNRMREQTKLSAVAKWRLAAAYAKSGMPEVAIGMINDLKLEETENLYSRGHGVTYGSHLRDKAMILETLGLVGDEQYMPQLMKDIASALASNKWLSTQETAYSLISISEIYKKNKGSEGLKFVMATSTGTENIATGKPIYQTQLVTKSKKKSLPIQLNNTSGGLLFVRVIKTFVPLQSDTIKKQSRLAMDVKYVDYQGNALDPTKLEEGMEFKAVIRVKNTSKNGYLNDMALSFMVPAGWEIENTRLMGNESGDGYVYRDFRDDRVYTYFNMSSGQLLTYEFKLTATYGGRFFKPMITADNMYNNSISATIPGGWVEVVERQVQPQ